MKKWKSIVPCIGLAVLLGLYSVAPHPEPGEGLRADNLCKTLLVEKENHEALTWLEQAKPGDIKTIGEQAPEESLRIVQNLYSAGALKAHVIEIERAAGYGETTNIVCVQLPTDPASRQRLFKIQSRIASSQGFDAVPDEGQTYLFLCKSKLSLGQYLRSLLHR